MADHTPALASADYLEGRPQDMRLRLNTPQMNRLKYLVGRELDRYIDADLVPEYDGDEPLLVVSDHELGGFPVVIDGKTRYVLRSATKDEIEAVLDLKAQLDNLWAGNDRVTGDYNHRNIESVTSDGPLCEECGEEEHDTDHCPHLQAMVDHDDRGFGYVMGEDA